MHAAHTLVSAVPSSAATNADNSDLPFTTSSSALDECARRLATPLIGELEFLLLVRSFRHLIGASDGHRPVKTTHACCTPREIARVSNFLRRLAESLSRGVFPSLERFSQDILVPSEEVNHLLKMLTNADFRQCRRGLRVRPTVPEVASSSEQIAQLAYRHGYQWPGQLDRDFKATLLLTPNAFRRLVTTDSPLMLSGS